METILVRSESWNANLPPHRHIDSLKQKAEGERTIFWCWFIYKSYSENKWAYISSVGRLFCGRER